MKLPWHDRRPPTEAELLAQISRSIRIAYGPTPWWAYGLALAVAAGLAYAFGLR